MQCKRSTNRCDSCIYCIFGDVGDHDSRYRMMFSWHKLVVFCLEVGEIDEREIDEAYWVKWVVLLEKKLAVAALAASLVAVIVCAEGALDDNSSSIVPFCLKWDNGMFTSLTLNCYCYC